MLWTSQGIKKMKDMKIDLRNNSWVMDFETSTINGKSIVVIATYSLLSLGWKFKEYYGYCHYYHNSDVLDSSFTNMIKILRQNRISKKSVDIWFNNSAGYDNKYIVDWLLHNNFKQTFKWDPEDNEFCLLAGDKIKFLELKFKFKGYVFIIRDFYKFARLSIEKMGEILGIKKLNDDEIKIFYNKDFTTLTFPEITKYVNYALRDVEILHKMFIYFHNSINMNSSKYKTLQSLAVEDWKLRDSGKTFYKIPSADWFEDHYFGGYTIGHPKYKNVLINDTINCYDINSAYPAVMLEPVPLFECEAPKQPKKLYHIRITKAILKEDLPPIIRNVKKLNGFFKKINESVYLWVWENELHYFNLFYDIDYTILATKLFESGTLFTNYILHWYKIKQDSSLQLSKEPDNITAKIWKETSKLMMNSLYGKFGQKPFFPKWYITEADYEKHEQIEVEKKFYRVLTEKNKIFPNKNLYNIVEIDEAGNDKIPADVNNNFVASFITAAVRCKLFELIYDLKDKFLYSDTDSIYCIGEIPPRYINAHELGKWKLERTDNYFKYLKAKCYIVSKDFIISSDKSKTKITIAGASDYSNLYNKTLNDFTYNITLGKKASRFLEHGIEITDTVHLITTENEVIND